MRVLVSSTWGHGHVFPLVPLAQALLRAGHEVRWVAPEVAVPLVAEAGVPVRAGGLTATATAAALTRIRAELASVAPERRAAHAFPNLFGRAGMPAMVPALLAEARTFQPDVLVHETAELAAPLVAALLGLPCVTHAFGTVVPTPIVEAAAAVVAPQWSAAGIDPAPLAGLFAGGYLDLWPASLQHHPLGHITSVQPVRPVAYPAAADGAAPGWTGAHATRPQVYVTVGTVAAGSPVLATALAGVTAVRDPAIRVLVAVGPGADPAAVGPHPDWVRVQQWVNQSAVLADSAAVVSHAGSGTFLGALRCGLPQVCLPLAADQFRNTAAGVACGAAIGVAPDALTPDAVARAVTAALTEPSYAAAAAGVAAEIARMPTPDEVIPYLVSRC